VNFTKHKFLDLPFERRHKKCAELLRIIFDLLLSKNSIEEPLQHYQQMQKWMEASELQNTDLKTIADRYHEHLKQAKFHLKEHSLLTIRKGDSEQAQEPWPIAIYLDNLRSAHNVGSIIRTTEALSLGQLYFSSETPFIDNKQVQDAAMGTHEWVKCSAQANLNALPKPIVALETSPQAISLHDFIFPDSFTLVVGNEEYGCSDAALKQTDFLIEIPLRGRKNSLNVANAFAIAAVEIQRQRGSHERQK